MTKQTLRIATRTSELALWQAKFVANHLKKHHANLSIELLSMKTKGDKLLDTPLAKIGGKGLFVKELEQALLENRADIAVHSMKDVPAQVPDTLCMGAVGARACPWDALVGPYANLSELPQGARVGTSSLRRLVQLRAARPDLDIRPLRGNVNTRLAKLEQTELHAIILASAGLERLDMAHRISAKLDICQGWLPAFAQGTLGIECRENDQQTLDLIRCFDHTQSHLVTLAEREVNQALDGGCQVPMGGYAQWLDEHRMQLDAFVSNGKQTIRAQGVTQFAPNQTWEAKSAIAHTLGQQVANQLKALKATQVLDDARAYFAHLLATKS